MEGLEVPDLIKYNGESSDNSDNESIKLIKNVCDLHCAKWMRGHSKSKCKFANHLMSNKLSDQENFDGVAGNDPEGATAKLKLKPPLEETYCAVNSTENQSLVKPPKMSNQNLFIADTGATCHIKTNSACLTNLQKVNKTVCMGQLSVKILFQGDYECKGHKRTALSRK